MDSNCSLFYQKKHDETPQMLALKKIISERIFQFLLDHIPQNKIFKKLMRWLVMKLAMLNERMIFDKRLIEFYKSNLQNKINFVIDVGANTGQSTDLFLKLNPNCKIIAFEPIPSLYQKLKRKYSDKPNIQLFQLGISDVPGQKTFYENIFQCTSTFEELDLTSEYLKTKSKVLGVEPDEIVKESYPIEVTTISDFINNRLTEKIDILKIDTEGHEYACLTGLFKSKLNCDIEYIQLEQHTDDMYLNRKSPDKIYDILNKNGYEIEAIIKHGFGDLVDLVFRKNDLKTYLAREADA